MANNEESRSRESGGESFPERASRLGPSLSAQGEITGTEDLVLRGPFKGLVNLSGGSLYIADKAVVEAEVDAINVFIHGALTGNIKASGRVFVASTARMNGNIFAAQISIQDGARFKGAIQMKS